MLANQKNAELLKNGNFNTSFAKIYDKPDIAGQIRRYLKALAEFEKLFGERDNIRLFSAPGRTELGGNHTDHNRGRVIAASINLDVIAIVSENTENIIRIKSEGHSMDVVDLNDLSKKDSETGRSSAIVRGLAYIIKKSGLNIGGFDAYTTSSVLKGSGLSSSAAFEVLVGTIISYLFNRGNIDPVDIAKYSQYAENAYFGKPCGLMDQMASSVGCIVSIDFEDVENPIVEKVDFDFDKTGFSLCVVDTGGNHSDLTDEYAAILKEMTDVAGVLGKDFLRGASFGEIIGNMGEIRSKCGDRGVLRAMHFIRENERAACMADVLKQDNFDKFLQLTIESGHSSFEYLQNIYSVKDYREQGISLALCLAQEILRGNGAWRVHGGGFAGTTLNYVPDNLLNKFIDVMTRTFGEKSCHILRIRKYGGIELIPE